MEGTLQAALDRVEACSATRIHRLRMRVGVLSGVVPEALQFAFEALRENTQAAEAVLEIENIPVACWCSACQAEFRPVDYLHECPKCSRPSSDMRHGLELELVSMEVS